MKQISILGVLTIAILVGCNSRVTKEKKEDKITVAAYYFPNYHTDDARNAAFKGEGWA